MYSVEVDELIYQVWNMRSFKKSKSGSLLVGSPQFIYNPYT